MLDTLLHLDRTFFFFINTGHTNSFLDWILPLFRDKYFWTPLYLFIICFLIMNYKQRGGLTILILLIAIVLSDQISSSLIKPLFERLRPCSNPLIAEHTRLLVECGTGYSFTSSHAANHFTLAIFIIMLFYDKIKWIVPVGFLWASSICYAQIYVGLHYPADVIGGAFIGILLGLIAGAFCRRMFFAYQY